jgi:uncharacterized membrane protein
MKQLIKDKYLNALVMLLAVVAIVHVVVLIAAQFLSQSSGILGLKVFWAHLTGGAILDYIVVLAILGGLYYYFLKK